MAVVVKAARLEPAAIEVRGDVKVFVFVFFRENNIANRGQH